jgi:deoxyribodipyrimidine photolyase-related protein
MGRPLENHLEKNMQKRCTVWILGDQLLGAHPALTAAEAEFGRDEVCVVLVESRSRFRRLPYHRKKQVLLMSAMRHYAQELAARGYRVDYQQSETFLGGLRSHAASWQPDKIFTMAASAFQGREFQHKRLGPALGVPVDCVRNTQFLVERYNPIPDPEPGKRYVMESFYRSMRRHFDVLMDAGEPAGGRWNYDAENRKPLPRGLVPPPLPTFEPDEITRAVIREIAEPPGGVGELEPFDLAVNRKQAQQAFADFLAHRLELFGPYEDAISREYAVLFHSVLSPYLNIGLLDPLQVVQQVQAAYAQGLAPINSVEGFIRQVLGWREYMYWQYWRLMPGYLSMNFWQVHRPVPEMFWNGKTRMACLRATFQRIHQTGYAHHIERLMLLSNFSLLAGLDPAAVNNWFLASFIDAYEWVMVPNVIGMGLHADGGLAATKPYIASANYIHRMSDYCQGCAYDRKQRVGQNACPFNTLYWNFLLEHEEVLRKNPRMGRNVLGLRYLDDDERQAVRAGAKALLASLDEQTI